MGESHPNQATTPDCQSLTEQPTKYLQTMGNLAGLCPLVGVACEIYQEAGLKCLANDRYGDSSVEAGNLSDSG